MKFTVDAGQMCSYEWSIHLRMRAQIFAQSSAPTKLLDDERPKRRLKKSKSNACEYICRCVGVYPAREGPEMVIFGKCEKRCANFVYFLNSARFSFYLYLPLF